MDTTTTATEAMSDVALEFWKRIGTCERLLNKDQLDYSEATERELLELLGFIQSNPAHKSFFKIAFVCLVLYGRSDMAVVEFCMGTLMWPEVHEAVLKKIDADGLRTHGTVFSVQEVFEDSNWKESSPFAYYRNQVH